MEMTFKISTSVVLHGRIEMVGFYSDYLEYVNTR